MQLKIRLFTVIKTIKVVEKYELYCVLLGKKISKLEATHDPREIDIL